MKYKILLLIGALLCNSVFAAAPSKESIEKLLVVTEVEKLLASMYSQLDGMMENSLNQALRGKNLPPEAQQFSDSFRKKMVEHFKTELSWEKMKDIYTRIYAETFTQEEIDGLIAFYTSPAGKAFTAKMPVVMQKSMAMTQEMIGPMMQKTQQSLKETLQEIEAMQKKN